MTARSSASLCTMALTVRFSNPTHPSPVSATTQAEKCAMTLRLILLILIWQSSLLIHYQRDCQCSKRRRYVMTWNGVVYIASCLLPRRLFYWLRAEPPLGSALQTKAKPMKVLSLTGRKQQVRPDESVRYSIWPMKLYVVHNTSSREYRNISEIGMTHKETCACAATSAWCTSEPALSSSCSTYLTTTNSCLSAHCAQSRHKLPWKKLTGEIN